MDAAEIFVLVAGGDLTFYSKPGALDAPYGRRPVSYKLFLRIRPGKMKDESHAGQVGN